ncbi:MAG: hypothetical protein RMH75_00055 [Archaeoglobaceae archaeon]|nr:hypothetical protein [Archaeoglobaceae archaeon]
MLQSYIYFERRYGISDFWLDQEVFIYYYLNYYYDYICRVTKIYDPLPILNEKALKEKGSSRLRWEMVFW